MRLKDSYHPYAATAILFWSMAFVFTRLGLQYFTVYSLGLLRYLVASVTLVIVAIATRMKPPALKDVPWFLLAGAIGIGLYMIVFNLGSQTVSASTGSVILATSPIFTALLARIFYREKLTAVQYVAIAVAFAGVVVLTVLRGGLTVNTGVILMFASSVMISFYNILQRRLTRTYSALQATAIGMFLGTLMLCVFLPRAVDELLAAPPIQYVYLFILGVFSSALAYCAWAKAFALAEHTSSVSNYMFITPFLSTLLGLWLAGEAVEISTVLGGVIILGGLALFRFGNGISMPKARSKQTKAP